MKGADLAEAMASAVDRIVSAREGTGALDRAIEAVVGTIGRFTGKDATKYLASYGAEMLMRDIPEDRRLAGFPRVAMPSIHAEVLEVRAESRTWEEFEGRLLEKYGLDDALRLSKRSFMEWVESPGKGRNASALLREFEENFARLSALDRMVLDTSRVLLFVKSVDERDRSHVGALLETEDGLTADWAAVKRACGRFDKRREWEDDRATGSGSVAARKLEPAQPVRREETREWLESGSAPTGVIRGTTGGAALEELTRAIKDLQIAQARREGGGPARDRRPAAGNRCMWCDGVGHIRKDCGDFAEALRNRVVYLWEGRVHANDTRRALNRNDGRGGMKRLMEEAAARHAETVHYSASAGIRVGGGEARKESKAGFWPTMLEGLAGAGLKREESDRKPIAVLIFLVDDPPDSGRTRVNRYVHWGALPVDGLSERRCCRKSLLQLPDRLRVLV